MNDPLAPIVLTAADFLPGKTAPEIATAQAALNTKQAADRAGGNAVTAPAGGYRLATRDERNEFTQLAKTIERASRVPDKDGKLGAAFANALPAKNAVFKDGYWWVKT